VSSSLLWRIALAAGVVGAYATTQDPLATFSVVLLWIGWWLLRPNEGPPVLALAFSFQWMQITLGLFYTPWTGHRLLTNDVSTLTKTELMALAGLMFIVGGIRLGQHLMNRLGPPEGSRPLYAFSWKLLLGVYVGSMMIVASVQQFAWDYPSLTQGILALTYLRLAILYLILRRLVQPTFQWLPFAAIIVLEVGIGFTGFFAGFREPLIMAVVAMLEGFDTRKTQYWAGLGVLTATAFAAGLFWIGVRKEYREAIWANDAGAAVSVSRVDRLSQLSSGWAGRDAGQVGDDLDRLVDRMWTIYYPALAVERVPSVVAHTGGQLMQETLIHVFSPRVFYPDKKAVTTDSDLVRRYAGVWVAGEAQNTNIAFGYLGESYVDFGMPLMFVPMFVFGILVGVIYEGFLRYVRCRELAIGTATVVCWLSLYQFERSWVKTVGLTLTLAIYVGSVVVMFDRFWSKDAPEDAQHDTEADDDAEADDEEDAEGELYVTRDQGLRTD
jgi:hypothetical protein